MNQKLYYFPLLIALLITTQAIGQQVIPITDNDLQGGQTYNWTKDNIYQLDGFVYLEEGGVLNIEAGTVIQSKETPSNNDNASALIITRGAQIFAAGTEAEPIIFTSELDDVNDPDDLGATDRGLWGGLILLGRGVIANPTPETRIEGIPEGEDRALFGGNDDTDNSGVLSYVSIRHGGAELAPGDEINGLTLGAVGSGTQINHVEVLANSDDGIEFFGGTVSIKFASVAFCGDDSFDWDLGWRGKGQFWFALVGEDTGDNTGELDGAVPDDGEPHSAPTLYNITFLGAGCNSGAQNNTGLLFRDGSGGFLYNSIIGDNKFGIEVEDIPAGLDSRQRMANGELLLANNLWWGFCNGNDLSAGDGGFIRASENAEDPTAQFLIDSLAANDNVVADPLFANISRTADGALDPRPNINGPAYLDIADLPDDDFFQVANFKGAFGSTLWLRGWTALDALGFLPDTGNEEVITDSDLQGGQNYNWTNDKVYVLDGFVYLEEGSVLNIQEGTVIKARETPSNNDNASALIITRGAQIIAEGTEEAPIIFTTELDDVNDPNDLTATDRGLWGGLILLGRGVIANPTPETRIEGIPEGEPRALFGGNDDSDNSGVLRYVSIRHGGAELAPGDEINGLTLGAVGSKTIIEHVEVLANSDDGIEFFGGTVSVKFATVAFCGDDAFDWDLGWRGKGQFWFALVGEDTGDNTGELDGAVPDDGEPHSAPTLYNITFLGAGCDGGAQNNTGMLFRDGSGGFVYNSILAYNRFGIEVEDRPSGLDSRQRMENGELVLANNLWWGFCNGNDLSAGDGGFIRATEDAEDLSAQFLVDHLGGNANAIGDPLFRGISRTNDGGLDPRPGAGSPALEGTTDLPDDDEFFQVANYKGAFGGSLWLRNWTALDSYGFLPELGETLCETIEVITDNDLQGGETYNWTSDQCYEIDGFVYLEEDGILNIQEGTIILGREIPSNNDNASALIITRGAQIFAEGTAEAPIIFTSELSNEGQLELTDRGLWGGLILLGRGVIANPTPETRIEGIPEGEPRALFGGQDDTDNSGVLRYVSIRHGGAELAPGDEINGLTLGAVGSETIIENVEVVANSDDGIEFFGGTVGVKYASVAFCGDDAFDWDLGWRGKGQYWLALVGEDTGDNTGELDGAVPDDGEPHSAPTLYNITFIGAGCESGAQNNTGLLLRDGSGGFIYNSIFTANRFGIEVEDRPSGLDSRQRMENGELVLANNLWGGFCNGNDLVAGDGGFIRATEDAEDPTAQFLIDHLAANANVLGDPAMTIARTADGTFNPSPDRDSDAATAARKGLPFNDPFFTRSCFLGAFDPIEDAGIWIQNWTALAQYGLLNPNLPFGTYDNYTECGDLTSTESLLIEKDGYILTQNRPNPFNGLTQIEFNLPESAPVSLVVFDMHGRIVRTLIDNDIMNEGTHQIEFNAANLQSGFYYYSLRSGRVVLTKEMVVVK